MSHARLGPSNTRWPYCAGSPREEARFPDIAGEAAIDGTGSHLLLELSLMNGVAPIQYDQQIIGANHPEHPSGWLVHSDRIERVQMCLNYVIRRVNELKETYPGCSVVVESESKSDPGGMFGRTDWNGTCDITITARHPMTGEVYFLEVIDYKDGRGWVAVNDNTQLLAYLGGKMRHYIGSGPEKVKPFNLDAVPNCRMTVVQPKTSPPIRYVCSTRYEDHFSTEHVIEKLTDLALAAYRTDKPDAPLTPGKHCQYCKANPKRGGDCMASTEASIQVLQQNTETQLIATDKSLFEFIGSSFAKVKELTNLQLADLYDAKSAIDAAFASVHEEIQRRVEDEKQHVPGYEMLPGNNAYVWNEDEEKIVKMLKGRKLKQDQIYVSKLISPAQMDKLTQLTVEQKAKIRKEYVTTKEGKLSLQKVARKTVEQCITDDVKSVELMFGNIAKPAEVIPPTVSFF